MKVAIFFGSKSDIEKMKGAANCLKEFGIEYEAYILSAHRVPEKLEEVLSEVEKKEAEVILAGVIASKTILPVIGVPLNAALGGTDSLYSIVQMPKSIPVATVGIDNSYNAGMLAVEILAIKYSDIKEKLIKFRKEMKEKFISENENKVDF